MDVRAGRKTGADVEELPYPGFGAWKRTARPRNARLARISRRIVGRTVMTSWATIRSAVKLSLPLSQ